jgi:hypothetical protein
MPGPPSAIGCEVQNGNPNYDRVRAIAFANAGYGVMSSRLPTERANVRELGAYP